MVTEPKQPGDTGEDAEVEGQRALRASGPREPSSRGPGGGRCALRGEIPPETPGDRHCRETRRGRSEAAAPSGSRIRTTRKSTSPGAGLRSVF